MTLKVEIAGEEQMPAGEAERAEVRRLCDSNGRTMNELFLTYFGLNFYDRYMGSFPYADRETGSPRVAWALSMRSPFTRDAIVACLRAAIREVGLEDIVVNKKDDDRRKAYPSPWPHNMEIVAMGPTITDTLVGERRIEAALNALASSLSRE